MKKQLIQLTVVCSTFLIASCATKPKDFGEDFSSGWQAGGSDVIWQNSIGTVSGGQRIQIIDGDVCVANEEGEVFNIDLDTGSTSLETSLKRRLTTGSTCTKNSVATITSSGDLIVVDRDLSEIIWSRKLGTTALGSPQVTNNTLIVFLVNGKVIAYSIRNGDELWELTLPSSDFRFDGHFRPVIDNSQIFFGIPEGSLYAMDTVRGVIVWQTRLFNKRSPDPTANLSIITGPSFVDNIVCAAAYNGLTACVNNNTGQRIFELPISSASNVVSDGGSVFLIDNEGSLVSLSLANNSKNWQVASASSNRVPLIEIYKNRLIVDNGFSGLSYFDRQTGEKVGGIALEDKVVDIAKTSKGISVLTSSGKILNLAIK